MKLIIDIPDKLYNTIQSLDWKNGELVFSKEWIAIHNGIPLDDVLDKITEEIEKYKADCGKPEDIGYFSEVNQRTKGAYETCLRIINYWRNEVSE